MVATGANAQTKAVNDAVKAVNKAKAEAENPKKAGASATWVKLANAYVACYDAPANGLLAGSPKFQIDLVLKGQPALSSEKARGYSLLQSSLKEDRSSPLSPQAKDQKRFPSRLLSLV